MKLGQIKHLLVFSIISIIGGNSLRKTGRRLRKCHQGLLQKTDFPIEQSDYLTPGFLDQRGSAKGDDHLYNRCPFQGRCWEADHEQD